MPYSIIDNDPVWMNPKPVKIWATSKISYNRYIDDAKLRYNLLCSCEIKDIQLSDIDHIEIIRDKVDYYFSKKVCISKKIVYGQFTIKKDLFYDFSGNKISAHYLNRNE